MTSLSFLVLSSTIWVAGQQKSAGPVPLWPTAVDAQFGKNGKKEELSDAERVARLQEAIEKDQALLDELKGRVDDPDGDYAQAEKGFKTVDSERSGLRKKIQLLRSEDKTVEADKLAAGSEFLEGQWLVARERFNLAIQERTLLRDQIGVLRQQLDRRKQALTRLTRTDPDPAAEPNRSTAGTEKPGKNGNCAANGKKGGELSTPPEAGAPKSSEGNRDDAAGRSPSRASRSASTRLAQAEESLRLKEQAVADANQRVERIAEWKEKTQKSLELAKKLGDNARKRADQAQQEQLVLKKEHARRVADNAEPEELDKLAQRITETGQRMAKARDELAGGSERLQELRQQVAAIESKHAAAISELKEKEAGVEEAQRVVDRLEDPFSLPNLIQWARDHGPKLALILLGMFVLQRLVRLGSRRLVHFIALHGNRNTQEENQSRAQTLVSVFHNAASVGILAGGVLMLLDALGVPIMPLLGGAAVAGLAVAFGAQNLIRDYFSGFMVLMEDQYGINDVVKIGTVTGTVERITLRVTVLRDLSGIVHFIPHGTIATVSNLTHGWSRKVFDISVSPSEDVNRVMEVLIGIGRELRRDPAFAPLILEEPEMLGVDHLGDKAVIIRFFFKTRPLKQWLVKREMLRRIKRRFDELGIESPFSQPATDRVAKGSERAAA